MKTKKKESVIKEWVTELPFTQQAVLLVGLRGPDGLPKSTLVKPIIHYLRGVILHPAYPDYDPNKPGTPDGFMRGDYDNFGKCADAFLSDMEMYPLHFITHLMHAAEIVGYNSPDPFMALNWISLYRMMCKKLHLKPETKEDLNHRLSR